MHLRSIPFPLPLFSLLSALPLTAQAPVGADDPTAAVVAAQVATRPSTIESGVEGGRALAAPAARASFRTPIHTAPDDPMGGAYGTWAAGADYKVGFADVVTFIPYLGRDYPVVQQLRWQTLGVTAGDQSCLGGEQPVTWHDDFRFEYRHGAVVEAYDVRHEGLEQTFVLARRPANGGDVVVRGRLHTGLAGTLQPNGSIDFADAQGRSIVNYGAATAIDARGSKLAMKTAFEAGVVSLTVPASWLADAEFPVVIDPLLAPSTLWTGIAPAESLDLVRDDGSNQVLETYCRFVAAADADVWGRVYPDGWGAGGAGTLVFTDITAAWSTPGVDCSVCGPQDTFVIAVSREFNPGASIRVWAQPTSTATLVTTVLFAPSSSARIDWRPAVGGVQAFNESGGSAVGTSSLVVFQRDASGIPGTNTNESEIWALSVDCSVTPAVLGTEYQVASQFAGRDSELPGITKISEGGATTTWVVAYQEYNNILANDDWDLFARRVDVNAAGATEWFPETSGGSHRLAPKIAGQDGRYCVFYPRVEQSPLTKISGYAGTHVDCERFNWPVGGSITKLPATLLGTAIGGTRYLRVHGAAHDSDTNSFWTGLWHADGAGSRSMFVDRVGHQGGRVEGVSILPGAIDFVDGGIDYDDDGNNFVFTYGEDNPGASNPIRGNVLTFPAETPPSVGGLGCNAVTLTWSATDVDGTTIADNDQQIGHQYTRLSASGGPASGFHLMYLSLDPLNVVVLNPLITPGCRLLVDVFGPGYLGQVSDFGSSVSWNIPLPDSLPALTLHCQDWIYDLSTNLLTSSTRLTVPLERN